MFNKNKIDGRRIPIDPLINKSPAPKKGDFFNKWERIDSNTLKGLKDPVTDEQANAYYNGGACKLSYILAGITVQRDIVTTVSDKIGNGYRGHIGILEAGGEGKSTALLQLSVSLINSGYIIYYCDSAPELKPEIEELEENAIIIIDNANHVRNILDTLRYCLKNNIRVVFAARANEWKMTIAEDFDLARSIEEYQLSDFSEQEIAAFVSLLSKYSTLSKDEIEEVFSSKGTAENFLLAAMLKVMHEGKSLVNICKDILSNTFNSIDSRISKKVVTLFAFICLIEQSNCKMQTNLLRNMCKKGEDGADIEISELLSKILYMELQKTSTYVETRHPQISKCFLDILVKDYIDISDILVEFNYTERNLQNKIRNKETLNYYTQVIDNVNQYVHKNSPDCIDDMNDYIRIYIETLMENPYKDVINQLINNWAALQHSKNPEGDLEEEFSWRWICCNAIEKWQSNVIGTLLWWCRNEKHIGDQETPYSARWLYKKANERFYNDSAFLIAWAKLEAEQGNIGEVDIKYSARWIYKFGLEQAAGDTCSLSTSWAKFEEKLGRIGTTEEEYTSRWIYKQGFNKSQGSLSGLLDAWASFEISQGNIGTVDIPDSARWIYRQGYDKNPAGLSSLLYSWSDIETANGNYGDINTENTVRWIYNQAFEKNLPGLAILIASWGKLETSFGNIGETVDEPYTARWIYKNGLEKINEDPRCILIAWAKLEADQQNIGGIDLKHSARWLFKKSFDYRTPEDTMNSTWATYEICWNNFGSESTVFSAAWLIDCMYHDAKQPPVIYWIFKINYALYEKHLDLAGKICNDVIQNCLSYFSSIGRNDNVMCSYKTLFLLCALTQGELGNLDGNEMSLTQLRNKVSGFTDNASTYYALFLLESLYGNPENAQSYLEAFQKGDSSDQLIAKGFFRHWSEMAGL